MSSARWCCARVEALLDLTQGADPSGDLVKSARALLRQLGGEGMPGGARGVSPDRAWIVLGALPRVDRGEGAPADAARVEDFRRAGAALLDALLRSRRNAPLDPDGLEGSIAALIDLGRSISDVELRRAAVRGFVLDLKDLLPAARMMPLGVRRAAARGLALSIARRRALDLLQHLGEPRAAREIEYELLGALAGPSRCSTPWSGEDVVATLFAALAEDDFDSRSTACAVLLSSDVAPALRAQPLDLRWRWLAKRIPAEPSPELRRELLALLGRTGGPEAAAALLADDAVLDLCVLDGAPFIEALGAAFLELAAEDASALLAASGTLLGVPLDPSGAGAEALLPARAALLRAGRALDLAAFRANANVLAREDHLRALSAALELRVSARRRGSLPSRPSISPGSCPPTPRRSRPSSAPPPTRRWRARSTPSARSRGRRTRRAAGDRPRGRTPRGAGRSASRSSSPISIERPPSSPRTPPSARVRGRRATSRWRRSASSSPSTGGGRPSSVSTSLVARRAHNPKVAGSNPAPAAVGDRLRGRRSVREGDLESVGEVGAAADSVAVPGLEVARVTGHGGDCAGAARDRGQVDGGWPRPCRR